MKGTEAEEAGEEIGAVGGNKEGEEGGRKVRGRRRRGRRKRRKGVQT